jgi:hypothetical protein
LNPDQSRLQLPARLVNSNGLSTYRESVNASMTIELSSEFWAAVDWTRPRTIPLRGTCGGNALTATPTQARE